MTIWQFAACAMAVGLVVGELAFLVRGKTRVVYEHLFSLLYLGGLGALIGILCHLPGVF